jgi:cell division protein ZapC
MILPSLNFSQVSLESGIMLKPSDKWNWYFCDREDHLMLDIGDEVVFKTLLPRKLLVTCAFTPCQFTVEDACDYQTFCESLEYLNCPVPRKVELVLNCVAAKRFNKPVQPKSWFFEPQHSDMMPQEGEVVRLKNAMSSGEFIVIESGENASLCASVESKPFQLASGKELIYGQAIKVMHDRMEYVNHRIDSQPIALVS